MLQKSNMLTFQSFCGPDIQHTYTYACTHVYTTQSFCDLSLHVIHHTYTYTYVHTRMHAHLPIFLWSVHHTYTYTYVDTRMCTYIHICMHTFQSFCGTHTQIRVCVRTYTYACTPSNLSVVCRSKSSNQRIRKRPAPLHP